MSPIERRARVTVQCEYRWYLDDMSVYHAKGYPWRRRDAAQHARSVRDAVWIVTGQWRPVSTLLAVGMQQ